jgi:hypothetical protein
MAEALEPIAFKALDEFPAMAEVHKHISKIPTENILVVLRDKKNKQKILLSFRENNATRTTYKPNYKNNIQRKLFKINYLSNNEINSNKIKSGATKNDLQE